jgi:hypothetical protein
MPNSPPSVLLIMSDNSNKPLEVINCIVSITIEIIKTDNNEVVAFLNLKFVKIPKGINKIKLKIIS